MMILKSLDAWGLCMGDNAVASAIIDRLKEAAASMLAKNANLHVPFRHMGMTVSGWYFAYGDNIWYKY
ncbi:MAG: hypothetical protein JXA66_07220, partial [Oligoflexia bacterium]|nr:hypothetical protein [Oligoflexia bacterium]